jgi:hypothetical protein
MQHGMAQSAPNTKPKRQSLFFFFSIETGPRDKDFGTKSIDICQWQHDHPIMKPIRHGTHNII